MSAVVTGCLFLAGFAQAGQPHAAIVLATTAETGKMGHIVSKTGEWKYKFQSQNIANSLTLTSLVKIRDASKGPLSEEDLDNLLAQVPVPPGHELGECLNWVMQAVTMLAENGVVTLVSADGLKDEFSSFCSANRKYATRSAYPNVKTSEYCF